MKAHGMLAPDATVNVNIDARKQVPMTLSRVTESELRAIARGEPLPALTGEIGTTIRDAESLTPA